METAYFCWFGGLLRVLSWPCRARPHAQPPRPLAPLVYQRRCPALSRVHSPAWRVTQCCCPVPFLILLLLYLHVDCCRIPVVSCLEQSAVLGQLGVAVMRGFPVPGSILMDSEGAVRHAAFSSPITGTRGPPILPIRNGPK